MIQSPLTISVLSENSPGVLHRITTLFTKRKVNIESLTVSETEVEGRSRFTIVVNSGRDLVEKVAAQIRRVIEVIDVQVSPDEELIFREIAFYRVKPDSPQEVVKIATEAYARIVSLRETIIVEKTGTEKEIDELYHRLEPYHVTEFIRSGRIALHEDHRPVGAGK